MKEIGKKLSQERERKKLSIEEISAITKMPVSRLKAIEDGDLDFFKDDLTYVRFYVRSYCKALGIPYDNMKDDVIDSIDDYTNTMTLQAIKEQESIEQHIADRRENKGPTLAKKDRSSILQNGQQSERFRKVKRIDFAFLSLIVVSIVIVLLVAYVAITSFLDKEDVNSQDDPISEVTPKPEEEKPSNDSGEETDKDDKNEKDEEKDEKVTFKKAGIGDYTVEGIKAGEKVKFEVVFGGDGQFNFWKENTAVPNASRFALAKDVYTTEETIVAGTTTYTFNFWNYQNSVIKVNGQELKMDQIPAPVNGVSYVTLRIVGEANESAQ